LPAEISDLFPDSFEDSELGEIPSGWIVGKIRDLIEKTGMGPFGSRMKTETFQKSGVPIIKGGNLKGMLVEGCGHDYLNSEHAAELKSSCVRAGDIVITHRGTLGQVSMVPLEGSVGEYIVSQSQFYLRPASIAAGIYLLFFFHSPVGQNRLLENSSGVGVPSLARPSTLTPEIDVLLPPYPLLDLFAKQAAVVQKTFLSKQDEMDTLGSLRDALLPKLISGELRIPDAEMILEEVGI
jgi:type I restriction enzyme S subunit